MRVLWFSNGGLPTGERAETGGWLTGMAEALAPTGEIELGSAAFRPVGSLVTETVSGVKQWLMPRTPGEARDMLPSSRMVDACLRVIDEFKPDIIHIHGTEGNYGLLTARGQTGLPAVVSVQGLIHVIAQHNAGDLTLAEQIACIRIRDIYVRNLMFQRKRRWLKWAKFEKEIVEGNRCFIGRTQWDRAHIRAINPAASYYECHEVMRRHFYGVAPDQRKPEPHSIFVTTASLPLKGFQVLLRAAVLLKREFPDLQIRVAGPAPAVGFRGCGYLKWLGALTEKLCLSDSVVWLGTQDANGVLAELNRAAVYVSASFIENSSNAIVEAMLTGTPIVASFAGGTPSLVTDNETALMFQPGDEALLAECVREVFVSPEAVRTRAENARALATQRNAPEAFAAKTIEIYKDVIKNW